MNSFNHYAYGAIGDWLYSTVAGIKLQEDAPGYQRTTIHPHPGGELTHAKAAIHTQYGSLSSAWKIEDGQLHMDVVIPPNTRADIHFPVSQLGQIQESGKNLRAGDGWMAKQSGENELTLEVGSGKYEFKVKWE